MIFLALSPDGSIGLLVFCPFCWVPGLCPFLVSVRFAGFPLGSRSLRLFGSLHTFQKWVEHPVSSASVVWCCIKRPKPDLQMPPTHFRDKICIPCPFLVSVRSAGFLVSVRSWSLSVLLGSRSLRLLGSLHWLRPGGHPLGGPDAQNPRRALFPKMFFLRFPFSSFPFEFSA